MNIIDAAKKPRTCDLCGDPIKRTAFYARTMRVCEKCFNYYPCFDNVDNEPIEAADDYEVVE